MIGDDSISGVPVPQDQVVDHVIVSIGSLKPFNQVIAYVTVKLLVIGIAPIQVGLQKGLPVFGQNVELFKLDLTLAHESQLPCGRIQTPLVAHNEELIPLEIVLELPLHRLLHGRQDDILGDLGRWGKLRKVIMHD